MFDDMNHRQLEMLRDLRDRAEDDIADVIGMPRKARPPRVPQTVNVRQVVNMRDNYGVVSAGVIRSIQNSIGSIEQTDGELAGAFSFLTRSILASPDLPEAQKREATELVKAIAEDAARPPAARQPKAVFKAVGSALQAVLSNVASLAQIWSSVSELLDRAR